MIYLEYLPFFTHPKSVFCFLCLRELVDAGAWTMTELLFPLMLMGVVNITPVVGVVQRLQMPLALNPSNPWPATQNPSILQPQWRQA